MKKPILLLLTGLLFAANFCLHGNESYAKKFGSRQMHKEEAISLEMATALLKSKTCKRVAKGKSATEDKFLKPGEVIKALCGYVINLTDYLKTKKPSFLAKEIAYQEQIEIINQEFGETFLASGKELFDDRALFGETGSSVISFLGSIKDLVWNGTWTFGQAAAYDDKDEERLYAKADEAAASALATIDYDRIIQQEIKYLTIIIDSYPKY